VSLIEHLQVLDSRRDEKRFVKKNNKDITQIVKAMSYFVAENSNKTSICS